MKNFILGVALATIVFLVTGAALNNQGGPYQLVVDKVMTRNGGWHHLGWVIDQSSGDVFVLNRFDYEPLGPVTGTRIGGVRDVIPDTP